ncbi:hypothetical protein HMPREF0083_05804 [Aneurinibacillus aneurinilyticus ATCC 12856]|jgi:hypothetical protein|uniref:Uncharacterized protein n=1 Tax=Aneurinibacillus aneurinilyticus ATCC 12856 TaxID=649747 RepID=U1WR23_ANEAE|nr:hypothetical protein HMPREF0083_05804 [Aneurinibacillus aneurinilyticus ATCC 12856]
MKGLFVDSEEGKSSTVSVAFLQIGTGTLLSISKTKGYDG